MKTIETKATIMPDGTLRAKLTVPVIPGEHQVVIVIDEQAIPPPERLPLRFSAYPAGIVSESFTFRRQDLYKSES